MFRVFAARMHTKDVILLAKGPYVFFTNLTREGGDINLIR